MTDKVRIMSLGGLSDIGSKNCYLIIHNGIGYMLDCGQEIPNFEEDETNHGLSFEYVANFDEIPQDVKQIAGVFISHDHMDHVGGINKLFEFLMNSYRFRDKPLPVVFAPQYSANMIQSREFRGLKADPPRISVEHTIAAQPALGEYDAPYLKVISDKDQVFHDTSRDKWVYISDESKSPSEDDVMFKFFPVNHSVSDSLGIVVEVAGRKIIYTGDIRFHGTNLEETARVAGIFNREELRNADILLLDSTGIDQLGEGKPEEITVDSIMRIIEDNPRGRVFITTFSSHPKVFEVMERLRRSNNSRPVILHGSSMQDHMKWGRDHRPLDDGRPFSPGNWKRYTYGREEVPDNAIIFLTGSQGEPRSALVRLLNDIEGSQRDIWINKDGRRHDVVVFAARPIPGNEHKVNNILTQLKGRCLVYFPRRHDGREPRGVRQAGGLGVKFEDLHISGHAPQEDLKEIVSRFQPHRVMPVHAGRGHREMARELFSGHKFEDIELVIPDEHEQVVV